MISAENLSRLLLLLYEGASSPERLPAFLDALVHVVNADACVLREHTFHTEHDIQVETTTLFESAGYSTESLQNYQAYYWKVDPFLQRCLERFPEAECGVSQMLISDSEFKKTEFYSDWCRRYDNVGRMIWAKLSGDAGFHASVSLVRGMEAPLFGEAELQVIAAIAPHLRHASRLARSLRELKSSNALLQQGLDAMEIAISMVRPDGLVLRSTVGAEQLLAKRDGIWLHNGRLRAAIPAEQRTLDALIAGACLTSSDSGLFTPLKVQLEAAGGTAVRSCTTQTGGAMLIHRKESVGPLRVVLLPFCPGSLMNEPEATALVLFSDPFSKPKPRSAILRTLYGLTPTESRLCDFLMQGLELREAAIQLRITVGTARFHLKRVLAKTGARRQTELMRLMLSLPGT